MGDEGRGTSAEMAQRVTGNGPGPANQSLGATLSLLGLAIAVIASVSLIAATVVRRAGLPAKVSAADQSAATATAEAVAIRQISFVDRTDGSIVVKERPSGRPIATLPPETNAFLRSIMRSLVRERRTLGLGDEKPFLVARRRDDGSLSITDLATGRRLELAAFGSSNFAVFAMLLDRPLAKAAASASTTE